jgi:hypothetical protein
MSRTHDLPLSRRRTRTRRLLVGVSTMVATLMLLAGPARAGLELPVDFGTQQVGTTSAAKTATIPLTTTVDEIRPELLAAIATWNPPDLFGVTDDQVRQAVTNAVNAVPGTDQIAVRIDSITLATGTDFAVTGCVGADGASVPSCDVSATFTPTDIGDRSDSVSVGFTTTVFPTADVQAALAAALDALLPGLGAFAGLLLDQGMLVQDSLTSQLNPVAVLTGTGVSAAEVSEVPVAWGAPLVLAAAGGGAWLWRRRRSAVA